jgi:hypothetical protein
MSWNLHFELEARDGGDASLVARRKAGSAIASARRKARNLGSISLEPDEKTPLKGSLQILMREDAAADFVLLLTRLQQLARSEPEVLVRVTDEHYLQGDDVLTVGEPSALVDPRADPTQGKGVFRSADAAATRVHRAEVAKLDASAVARSFLDELAEREWIVWAGPPETVVARLAALVEGIEAGRWRGANAVLRILDDEASIDEVFADERQIDELWRRTVNRG